MILALGLHIAALLVWAAGLIYLPVLIRTEALRPGRLPEPPAGYRSLARWFFVLVATPAALLAIAVGTLVFLLARDLDPWLMLKLALVSLLVICHCLLGAVVMQLEAGRRHTAARGAAVLVCGNGLLMAMITLLVLAKPAL